MHPRPRAETTSPSVPSVRFSNLSPPQRKFRTLSVVTERKLRLKIPISAIDCQILSSMLILGILRGVRRGAPREGQGVGIAGHPAAGSGDERDEAVSEIDPGVLERLRRYDTATVCNLSELFDVRPHAVGYMDARIRACFPELPSMVGFAATATFRADRKSTRLNSSHANISYAVFCLK